MAYKSNIANPDNTPYTNYFRGYIVGHINGSVTATNCYGGSGYQVIGGRNTGGETSLFGATRIDNGSNTVTLSDLPEVFISNGWKQDNNGNLYVEK